ncbi:MAG: hypothetical protein HY675_28160 [Chloroflexi bacterium]|nr:hypothetical protein [Chloroflexota bacterium]
MRRGLLLLLAGFLLWPTGVFAETPAEYRLIFEEVLQAAEAAQSSLPAEASLGDYLRLRQALARLEAIPSVTTDSGTIVTIDNRALISRLQGSRDEGRQAFETLRQLASALDASLEKAQWTGEVEPRVELHRVLSQPEFRSAGSNPIGRFLDDLRARLFQWIESLFPGLRVPQLPGLDLEKPGEVIFWLITAALISFVVVFLAYTWRSARLGLARCAALQDSRSTAREDARSARMAAEKAAGDGDYRQAIHYLYLWAILHMSEHGRLRYDRSLTNREQLRSLSDGGEVAELFQLAVDAFDIIWYGCAACTSNEYGHFRAIVERIVGAAA